MSTFNWDMNNQHVDANINPNGVAVQANTILLAVGAPTLSENTTYHAYGTVGEGKNIARLAYPIGTADQVGIGQNKQLQMFFEIGSKKRYFVPGRVINNLQLNRVYLNGASLLKVMWAYYNQNTPSAMGQIGAESKPTFASRAGVINNLPGVGHLWLNLASELFDKPIGMLMYFKDNFGNSVGSIYLENCNITSHSFGINASSTLFSESVSLQFDCIKPVTAGTRNLSGIVASTLQNYI